jgi:hypothetical protein
MEKRQGAQDLASAYLATWLLAWLAALRWTTPDFTARSMAEA